ncbi:eukaryotic initiation factor- alpha subunit [Cyclospora cayetanensis]|uniref:Translation initiation factor eIF2B subunit alpha n=1 Tax=Cyclospora cayetanensis TaxID=88456 RepID=A0A1D3D8Z4_9EIME|nr:eukaryotic initiation factor- alpha subunit [Cyclospora cayetanensis]
MPRPFTGNTRQAGKEPEEVRGELAERLSSERFMAASEATSRGGGLNGESATQDFSEAARSDGLSGGVKGTSSSSGGSSRRRQSSAIRGDGEVSKTLAGRDPSTSSPAEEETSKGGTCSGMLPTEGSQVSLQQCVVDGFWRCFTAQQNDLALAAVHALATVVHLSRAESVLELFVHLRAATEALEAYASRADVLLYISKRTAVKRLTTLPLRSACSLYQQFAVRHFERKPQISAKFASRISQSKQTIADLGRIMFTKDQMVVLTHGQSSCVERLLCNAWTKHKKRFSVIITQHESAAASGGAFGNDEEMLRAALSACGIPAVLASVGSVARLISKVDLVVMGTEAVSENGGIINRIGTATVAIVASENCVPVYVVCEACKFARTNPLYQKDASAFSVEKASRTDPLETLYCHEALDYTRPEYISLLFTDLGIFTPQSISDELTKLYQ